MQEGFGEGQYQRTAAPSIPPRETLLRTYRHSDDMVRDSAGLAGQGFEVIGMMTFRRRAGWLRALLLAPIGSYFFPPRPEIIVTYARYRR